MAGAQPRTSCRSLFKQLEILPVPYHNTLSLINLIINNHEIFQTNSSTQCINMKTKYHLLRPNANLSCFRKSTFYAGTKIFNSLPPRVTILKNDNTKLKASLRKYLNIQSFYSVDEFFTCKDVRFCELFVVFYTVNLYIYVLFHILLSLWHTNGSKECMHVCIWNMTAEIQHSHTSLKHNCYGLCLHFQLSSQI